MFASPKANRLATESAATAAIVAGRCVTTRCRGKCSFAICLFIVRFAGEKGWKREGTIGTIHGFHARVVDRKRETGREYRTDVSRSFSDSLFVAENPRREYESAVERATGEGGGARGRERENFLEAGTRASAGVIKSMTRSTIFSTGNPTKTDSP